MEPRTLKRLEFPQVLSALSGMALSEPGRAACLEIAPARDPEEQRRRVSLLDQYQRFRSVSDFAPAAFEDLTGFFRHVSRSAQADETSVASDGILDGDDLFALKGVLTQARGARSAVTQAVEAHPDLQDLADMAAGSRWPEAVWSGLSRCLAPDGRLNDDSSPELFYARQEIRRINQTCTRRIKDFLNKENLGAFMQDDFVTVSADRFVLPLKTNFKGRFQGIVHDYSQTGETCYFEPLFLVELNNELAQSRQEERKAELEVYRMLSGLVRRELDSVHAAYKSLVDLDVLEASTRLGDAMQGRALPLADSDANQDEGLRLLEARHPLLVLSVRGKVVPTDIRLEPGDHALIISGGNAGGKTVCLKTLGLIAVMAQSGLPVPVAEGSRLPFFSHVFAFLGDEQSLSEHLSTFTAQIHGLATAWPDIGRATLVILDEFGAGTDPAQGSALAQAVIDSLMELGARVAAATHFPALKVYGLSTQGVRSASVLFDPKTRKPLYKLAYDQVGVSLALDVAREHGLPEAVLARAEEHLLIQGADTSALMERMNSVAVDKERELANLKRERVKLKDKEAKLRERFESEKAKLLDEVQAASRDILQRWQEGKVGQKKARQELAALKQAITGEEAAPEAAGSAEAAGPKQLDFTALRPGDAVHYLAWSKDGKVVEINTRKEQVKVDLSGVALWVDFTELVRPTGQGSQAKAAKFPPERLAGAGSAGKKGKKAAADSSFTMSIDLRGQRGDVAVGELAAFLDKAILRGASGVDVIHGRGTGALRREVHDFLKHFPAVKSFHLADEDHGGDGKTVVEMK